MVTRPPASRAWRASVAMMSSASKPSSSMQAMLKASRGLAGQRDLRAQVLGHRLAVGLVEVIQVVAEGVAALVEDHRHMGRRIGAGIPFDIALQHVAEPRHRPDGQPVRFARQRRQRVIGAEDEGRAVDQMQVATLAECHARPFRRPRARCFFLLKISPPEASVRSVRTPPALRPCPRNRGARICSRNRGIRPSPARAVSEARRAGGPRRLRPRHRPRGRYRQALSLAPRSSSRDIPFSGQLD